MDNHHRIVLSDGWIVSPQTAAHFGLQDGDLGGKIAIANYEPAPAPEFKPNRRQRRFIQRGTK